MFTATLGFLELPFHPTRLLIYEKCGETLNPETLAAQLVSNQFMAVRQVERPDIGDLSSLVEGGGWGGKWKEMIFLKWITEVSLGIVYRSWRWLALVFGDGWMNRRWLVLRKVCSGLLFGHVWNNNCNCSLVIDPTSTCCEHSWIICRSKWICILGNQSSNSQHLAVVTLPLLRDTLRSTVAMVQSSWNLYKAFGVASILKIWDSFFFLFGWFGATPPHKYLCTFQNYNLGNLNGLSWYVDISAIR